MIALAPEDLADLRRWAICAAVVVLAHGGIAAAMVTWHDDEGGSGPASGIVIEFAPVPLAASTPEAEIPPGPLQDASEASPNKPVDTLEEREKVETTPTEERPPEVAPATDPDVAVEPPPPQEVKQETAMRQAPSLASIASAPQVIAEETSAIPVAPTLDLPNPINSAAALSWNMQVFAQLKRNLRYPPKAASRGEKGIVQISFSLDRHGRVIDSRILSSSGVAELDQEALALLRRAQPFPMPPADLPGERFERNAPISFHLK